MKYGPRAVAAAYLVVLAGLLVAAEPVEACWCSPGNYVVWPLEQSTVSADTGIVLVRRLTIDGPSRVDVSLRAADGGELALHERLVLPESFQCNHELVFLQPERELEPGVHYTVTFDAFDRDGPSHIQFVARDKSQRPEAARQLRTTYLAVDPHEDCTYAGCSHVAELRVALDELIEEPVWVLIHSRAEKSQYARGELGPHTDGITPDMDWDPHLEHQLAVQRAPDDPCVDITVYGIDGLPLFEEQRCKPDLCARGGVTQSLCMEPPHSDLHTKRIPKDSCDEDPYPSFGEEYQFWYPAPDAGMPPAEKPKHQAPSCQAQPPSAASAPLSELTLMLSTLLCLTCRRQPTPGHDRSQREKAR